MKCEKYKKKIKMLNAKIRKQKKNIANFVNIIKDLKQSHLVNAEHITILEDCAGAKNFLKRQILNISIGTKQYL